MLISVVKFSTEFFSRVGLSFLIPSEESDAMKISSK